MYDILLAVVGIGLIALGLSLFKLDSKVDSWVTEVIHQAKLINDLYNKRFEDSRRLAGAQDKIRALEERLEGQDILLARAQEKIRALEGREEYHA